MRRFIFLLSCKAFIQSNRWRSAPSKASVSFCTRTHSVILSSRCVCIQSQVVPLLNSESFALENLTGCRKCNLACDDCEKNQFVQMNLVG